LRLAPGSPACAPALARFMVASLARAGARLQVARLRLAPGSPACAPALARFMANPYAARMARRWRNVTAPRDRASDSIRLARAIAPSRARAPIAALFSPP